MSVAENLARVQERIAAAARRAGRPPEGIILMAVTKTFPPEIIREAYAAGIRVFGENRVQEFAGKAAAVRDLTNAEWHMIGHLQTNKATKAVELFEAIDSVGSLRLAEKLNAAAKERGKKVSVLVEVNVGGEEAKSGVPPRSPEFENILAAVPRLEHLQFRGLMTIPPYTEDPQRARPYFKALRRLAVETASRQLPAVDMSVLSMGMSHDFELAIEEGSTCVRVGTAIFGARPPK